MFYIQVLVISSSPKVTARTIIKSIIKHFSVPFQECKTYLRVNVLTHLLRSFFEDKLRWRQADDGGLHQRPRQHIRESDSLDVSCSGARVSHTQVNFADVSDGDVGHSRYVAVTTFPLVLQDDVAGAAVTRQGDLHQGNIGTVRQAEEEERDQTWSCPHGEFDSRLWRSECRRFDFQLGQHAGHPGGGEQQVDGHVFFGTDGQFAMSSQTLLRAKQTLELRDKINQLHQQEFPQESETSPVWKGSWSLMWMPFGFIDHQVATVQMKRFLLVTEK